MRAGELLAERFRIERHAGAGAMGSVFRAGDLERGGLVAIKVLPPGVSLARFEGEVAALAGIQHDAVVRYVAHGQTAAREAFVAMEWIEGISLAERLAVAGLSGVDTLLLAGRLLEGLRALHAQGVIHRDLKPSNIMLPAGRPALARIVDLGIARLPSTPPKLTAAGAHLGTPRYMAPEQIRDPHGVDGRADVFSLGCVLYECLTCVPAFGGDEAVSVLAQVLFGRPPDPSEHRPELPDELERLLERLLSRSRRLRPQAGPELQAELARLLEPPNLALFAALPAIAPPLSAGPSSRAHTLASETAGDSSQERPSFTLLSRVSRVPSPRLPSALPERGRESLVGRARELAQARLLLERERVLALWGGAGLGKTRLALEIARRFAENACPPLSVFCELGEARDSADVVRIVTERAGLPSAAHADPELWLGRQLGKLGYVLLVLDRCEHLAAEIAPLVRLWVANAPGLLLLLTSRSSLGGTTALELGPLATQAPGVAQSRARPSEAAELVLARAALALGQDVSQLDAAIPHAEQIGRALDGNPLAIELAAARVPVLGFSGVVARLGAQLALLAADGEQSTMRAAIAWSWQLLDDAQRCVLMQCSVFRGSFTLVAAERVIEPPEPSALTPAAQTRPILSWVQSLREHSLLVSAPLPASSALEIRLTMSAALREFASTQLTIAHEQSSALAGVRARHAQYYAQLARSWLAPAANERGSPEPPPAARRLEHDNLLAAAEYALAADRSEQAAVIVLALEPALLAAGLSSPLASLLERVIAACGGASAPLDGNRARLRGVRARLLLPAGELAAAERELEAVRAEAEARGDRALLGTVWLDLGLTHHFARALAQAELCYQRALPLLSAQADVLGEARCHGNLGALQHDRGRLGDAAAGYRHAIALLVADGDLRLLANYSGNLALVLHELGQIQEARSLYERAADGFEEACDARWLGIVLGNWGMLELAQPAGLTRAQAMFERAYSLLEGSGDRRSLGLCAGRLALVYGRLGRSSAADRETAEAERLLRRDPLTRVVARCFRAFSELARAEHAAASGGARPHLERARELYASCTHERLEGRLVRDQSDDLRLLCALLVQELARVDAQLPSADQSA